MASPALNKLRAQLLAQPKKSGTTPPAMKVKRKREWLERALCAHGAADLWDRIRDCGTNRMRCGSLHCVRCFNRYVDHQATRVRTLFDRYSSETDLRANIRHLTVLFDAFGFDLHSKPYPTLSLERVKAARDFARKGLYALKRKYPAIALVGALELEPIDAATKAARKDASAIDALLAKGQHRNTAPSLYSLATASSMRRWTDHVVLYHGNFVVDLNGTPDRDFRDWCHARWGHRCPGTPVRRGAFVQKLYSTRTIDQSVQILARYPLKTPFHYHVPNKNGHLPATRIKYEDDILASVASAIHRIGIVGFVASIGV